MLLPFLAFLFDRNDFRGTVIGLIILKRSHSILPLLGASSTGTRPVFLMLGNCASLSLLELCLDYFGWFGLASVDGWRLALF